MIYFHFLLEFLNFSCLIQLYEDHSRLQAFWPKRWFPRISKMLAIEGLEKHWLRIPMETINVKEFPKRLTTMEAILCETLIQIIKMVGYGYEEINEKRSPVGLGSIMETS